MGPVCEVSATPYADRAARAAYSGPAQFLHLRLTHSIGNSHILDSEECKTQRILSSVISSR